MQTPIRRSLAAQNAGIAKSGKAGGFQPPTHWFESSYPPLGNSWVTVTLNESSISLADMPAPGSKVERLMILSA